MPNFSLPRVAYAGASVAAVLTAGVISGRIVSSPDLAAPSATARPHDGLKVVAASPKFDFYSTKHTFRLPEMDFDHPRPAMASFAKNSRPRYVLDTQPVSYEQPSSF